MALTTHRNNTTLRTGITFQGYPLPPIPKVQTTWSPMDFNNTGTSVLINAGQESSLIGSAHFLQLRVRKPEVKGQLMRLSLDLPQYTHIHKYTHRNTHTRINPPDRLQMCGGGLRLQLLTSKPEQNLSTGCLGLKGSSQTASKKAKESESERERERVK